MAGTVHSTEDLLARISALTLAHNNQCYRCQGDIHKGSEEFYSAYDGENVLLGLVCYLCAPEAEQFLIDKRRGRRG